ncbi:MAG: iron-sulfur cluster repair di-iron protein [Terriglobia bacterium]
MKVDATRRVKDVVAEFPLAAQIFERTGIDYCCGGEKSLQDACNSAHVKVEEILQSIENAGASASPQNQPTDWNQVPLSILIQYIVEKHHAYCRNEQERLGTLLTKVVQVHGANHAELGRIQSLFTRMAKDLALHLMKEENTLFPMILQMESAALRNEAMPRPSFGTIQNPVSMMILEHDESGRALKEMRSLSQGYEPPDDACASYRSLYQGFKEFEQDMHEHIYIENYVLFPRTVSLEKHFAAR